MIGRSPPTTQSWAKNSALEVGEREKKISKNSESELSHT